MKDLIVLAADNLEISTANGLVSVAYRKVSQEGRTMAEAAQAQGQAPWETQVFASGRPLGSALAPSTRWIDVWNRACASSSSMKGIALSAPSGFTPAALSA